MSWRDDLQDAAFRGVKFDVLNTQDSMARDHEDHEYPFIDGATVMDLGRKARNFRLTAFLWGENYKHQLDALMKVLDQPGTGELIHPIYGSVPQVLCIEYQIQHEAEGPDSCHVELVFLESTLGTKLHSDVHPEQLGDSLFDAINELTERASDLFEQVMAPVHKGMRFLAKGKAALAGMLNTLTIMRGDIAGVISQGVDYLKYPRAFVHDLLSILDVRTGGIGDLLNLKLSDVIQLDRGARPPNCHASSAGSSASRRQQDGYLPGTVTTAAVLSQGVSATTLLSAWGDSVAVVHQLTALPAALVQRDITAPVPMPVDASLADVRDLGVLYQVMAAGELANLATALLSDEVQPDRLSPADITSIVNTVRTAILTAIAEVRTQYQPSTQRISEDSEPVGLLWRGVVSQLKHIALELQTLAIIVMNRRPPLTRRTVTTSTNLHLLAHEWYGDYHRAAELARLNPWLRDPNAIKTGDILNAYTR
ncbi:DNA circularization protein [Xenorhabdus ehlersii]|uniref:DNA circulation protein n=1 Tax=Xenorhabdus ehlersii TaxID=290111 RepID=A0A2D0IL76_9GAMM|nr:DNA circularization N-terminal domain-containing protein [Xenorhabdus ehlersii]PHM22528.1 DNA circulation protein [Xenorhabdus ehlersii]RKE91404.1 prophage DNA circulation protein [Xenorhabdus ehlersii]